MLKKKEAKKIVGGLSKPPSKMPGPRITCPLRIVSRARSLGRFEVLRLGCYAMKNRYSISQRAPGHGPSTSGYESPKWVSAMVVLVTGHPFLDGTTQAIYKALNILKNF